MPFTWTNSIAKFDKITAATVIEMINNLNTVRSQIGLGAASQSVAQDSKITTVSLDQLQDDIDATYDRTLVHVDCPSNWSGNTPGCPGNCGSNYYDCGNHDSSVQGATNVQVWGSYYGPYCSGHWNPANSGNNDWCENDYRSFFNSNGGCSTVYYWVARANFYPEPCNGFYPCDNPYTCGQHWEPVYCGVCYHCPTHNSTVYQEGGGS